MKSKIFLIESAYWLGMIVALLLTVHSRAAQAQTIRYWVGCTVSHEHGQQCFKEFVSELKVEITGASGDSIVYGQAVAADSATWESWLVPEERTTKFGWITDSITWAATDTTFEGDLRCAHEWVHGEVQEHLFGRHNGTKWLFGEGHSPMWCSDVNPDGKHCNEHQSATREKICRKCLFSVVEREKWYQRFVAPPKSAFELLKEKQRAKQ